MNASLYILPGASAPILSLGSNPALWYTINPTTGLLVATRSAPAGLSTAYRVGIDMAAELFPGHTLPDLAGWISSMPLGATPAAALAQWAQFTRSLVAPVLSGSLSGSPSSWYDSLSGTLNQLDPSSPEYATFYNALHSEGSVLDGQTTYVVPPSPGNLSYKGSATTFDSLSFLISTTGLNLSLSPTPGYTHSLKLPTGTVSWSDMDALILTNGNDNVKGSKLNDCLYGARGHDTLDGGAGDDQLFGGSGNDLLKGGVGSNQLFGGEGHDTLQSISYSDTLDGGTGNDTYILRNSDGSTTVRDSLDPSGGLDSVYLYGKAAEVFGIEKIIVSNQLSSFSSVSVERPFADTQTVIAHASSGVSFLDSSANDLSLTGTEYADTFVLKLNSNDTLDGGNGLDTVTFQDPVFLNMDNTAWSLTRTANGLRYANGLDTNQSVDLSGIERIILSNQDDAVALDFNNLLAVDSSTGLATREQDFSIYLGGTAKTQANYAFLHGYQGQNSATVNGSGGSDFWRIFDIKNLVLSDKTGGSDTYSLSGNTSVSIRDTGSAPSDIDTLQFSFFSSLKNITINRNASGKVTSLVDTSSSQTATVTLLDPSLTTPFERFSVGFTSYNSFAEFEAAIIAAKAETPPTLPTLLLSNT